MKTVENIAKEALKAHLSDVKITWVTNLRYQFTKNSNPKPVIGHPRDHAPITWQIGTWGTNHDREFGYRYDDDDNDDNDDDDDDYYYYYYYYYYHYYYYNYQMSFLSVIYYIYIPFFYSSKIFVATYSHIDNTYIIISISISTRTGFSGSK